MLVEQHQTNLKEILSIQGKLEMVKNCYPEHFLKESMKNLNKSYDQKDGAFEDDDELMMSDQFEDDNDEEVKEQDIREKKVSKKKKSISKKSSKRDANMEGESQ